MRTEQLVLRCYVEQENDGSWFAICLDLNICARADSLKGAQRKLNEFTLDYLNEACERDVEHFVALIQRKAPAWFWMRYYFIRLLHSIDRFNQKKRQVFQESVPVHLAC